MSRVAYPFAILFAGARRSFGSFSMVLDSRSLLQIWY